MIQVPGTLSIKHVHGSRGMIELELASDSEKQDYELLGAEL